MSVFLKQIKMENKNSLETFTKINNSTFFKRNHLCKDVKTQPQCGTVVRWQLVVLI